MEKVNHENIEKKERGYRSFTEEYDLSGCYAGKHGVPIGVLLLFLLEQDAEFEFHGLTAEAQGEIGEERNILQIEKGMKKSSFQHSVARD